MFFLARVKPFGIAICKPHFAILNPLAHFFFLILLLNVIKGIKVYILELN